MGGISFHKGSLTFDQSDSEPNKSNYTKEEQLVAACRGSAIHPEDYVLIQDKTANRSFARDASMLLQDASTGAMATGLNWSPNLNLKTHHLNCRFLKS